MHKPFVYLIAGLLISMTGCKSETTEVSYTLSLSPSTMSLQVGQMQQLTMQTTAPSVTWSSSDSNVAEIYSGVVTAVGIGTAIITASVEGASQQCKVFVQGKQGETLALLPAEVNLERGATYQMSIYSAYDVPLTLTSSDPAIASVTTDGKVTALKSGVVKLSLTNGIETQTATVIIPHQWSDYSLVWSDEFNGTSLDASVWTVEENGRGGGNSEKQYYTSRTNNVRLENGNLLLQLQKEEYKNLHYTSGRINSNKKKAFKYGKIEARIKMPSGIGTWPAFWMMGDDYPETRWPNCGEIDIMEHVGYAPTLCTSALHTYDRNGTRGNNWSARSVVSTAESDYHIYGIEWAQEEVAGLDRITFYVDGQTTGIHSEIAEKRDENAYWPFNKDHFLIFNLAVGGKMGGDSIDDTMFNKDVIMYVDWVRVYQRHDIEQ